jgi:hypothetical protein
VPADADALVLLTLEELAVNDLREGFHHWVRTVCLPVRDGSFGAPLPHATAAALARDLERSSAADVTRARDLWEDVSREFRDVLRGLATNLEQRVSEALVSERREAVEREEARFRSRQGELSTLIEEQSLAKLEAEIRDLEIEKRQGQLFDEEDRLAELVSSQRPKEEELKRRRAHYELLREQLARERVRVMDHLLPRRFTLRGNMQVFPVAVEIRFPREAAR